MKLMAKNLHRTKY